MPQFDDEYQTPHNWQPYVNRTGEVIPACGVFQVSKTRFDPFARQVPVAFKPDSYGAQFHHRVSWHQPVEDNAVGYMSLPVVQPMLVAYKGKAPLEEDLLGPIDDFRCQVDVGGFRVLRIDAALKAFRRCLCFFEPLLSLTAELKEELADDSEAEAHPRIGGATDERLTLSVAEVLGLQAPMVAGTRVRVQWDTELRVWVAIAAGCGTG